MAANRAAVAVILSVNAGQVTRLLEGRGAMLSTQQIEIFIIETQLREEIPGINSDWFDREPPQFAKDMQLLGYGLWRLAAKSGSWIADLPPLPYGRLLSENDIRARIEPSRYRGDFGDDLGSAELVDAIVKQNTRWGIFLDRLAPTIAAALVQNAALVVVLYRPLHAGVFEHVPVDPQSMVHLVHNSEDAPLALGASSGDLSGVIFAKVDRGQVRPRFGFEVDGTPGRRELVIFLFGNCYDLRNTWETAATRRLGVDELDQLRTAVAKGNEQGDLVCGRLLFDVVS